MPPMRALRENLFVQFSVVSFLVLAIVAVTLIVILTNSTRSHAIASLVREAEADAQYRVLQEITAVDLNVPMTGERYERFHNFVKEFIVTDQTARIKLWSPDGTVIYSDDRQSVGTRFPDNKSLLKALLGETSTEIKIPTDAENVYERSLGTLMEVYTPIVFPGEAEPRGVLEIYRYYAPTAQTIGEQRAAILSTVLAGFVILYGALVSGVWRGWKTITTQRERQKQAEVALKRAADEWQTTFDSIYDLMSVQDKNFRIVRVNRAYAKFFGATPEEMIGRVCYQMVHKTNQPCPKCPFVKTLVTKQATTEEFLESCFDAYVQVTTSPVFDDQGNVAGCVHQVKDITERKKMQEQLIVTDRLASVGELSAGIAHEINNPLTSVIGFSGLLLERDALPDDVKDDLKLIDREAKRAADTVKNLLTFARRHETKKEPTDVNKVIQTVLELRAYEHRVNNIEAKTYLAPDLELIPADAFRLQQVFLNIVINAEYFMIQAHRRGTLAITTRRIGNAVQASFADDGPGILKDDLEHIFDPFFTTKPVGKGTGLGLSICHGIITEHGGRLHVESEPGKGAIFTVELPVTSHEDR